MSVLPAIQLTASEERFCREYAIQRNAQVAYSRAFPEYKGDGRIVRLEGARLLKNPAISARISELVEMNQEPTLTFEEHMYELRKIRDAAFEKNAFKVALEAEVLRGQLVGLHKMVEQPAPVHNHLHLHDKEVSDDARASAIITMLRGKLDGQPE